MSDPRFHRARCPHCGRELGFWRFHSGFGDQGFMYCNRDETVVVWESHDARYTGIVGGKLPWTLGDEEQQRVEKAMRPCPCGGRFAFANPPLCPCCHESLASLVPDSIYYIVTGKRIDADPYRMWITEEG